MRILVAAFVIGVLAHNAEEALWLPQWSLDAGRWHAPVTGPEFGFAVAALSLLLIGLAGAAVAQGPGSVSAYLFFGYAFAMAANAFVPHLAATVALRRYMPGTASGLLLNLPLGVALLQRGVADGWVARRVLAWVAPVFALLLVASIPLLFALGRELARHG